MTLTFVYYLYRSKNDAPAFRGGVGMIDLRLDASARLTGTFVVVLSSLPGLCWSFFYCGLLKKLPVFDGGKLRHTTLVLLYDEHQIKYDIV